ncbi:Protein of unknown function [Actinokineospora alba]|nr:uncharacterized protein DUF3558 [Actinokineospora alba]SDI63712.1 Protein of unknown function [Actinokineospora alba]
MKRPLVLVAVLTLMLAGCSDKTPGSPTAQPEPTSSGSPSPTTKSSATKPSTDESPLKSVDPCDLLDASAMRTLGIAEPGEDATVGKSRGCQWRVDKGTTTDSYSIDVGLFETLGIKDVRGDGAPKPVTVGSRKAVQTLRGGGSGCAISIEVTEKSRVDVQAAGASGEKLCPAVLEAAKLVEPELP